MFMATSSVPSEAPNTNSSAPSPRGVPASDSSGRTTDKPMQPAMIIGLLPYRSLITPVSAIAPIDPRPRHSNSRPRTTDTHAAAQQDTMAVFMPVK